MIVVRSRNKQEYLEALHQSDLIVGPQPYDGAHASLADIHHFLDFFNKLVVREIQSNIDFINAGDKELWWYDEEQISLRSPSVNAILSNMHFNPDISVSELAGKVGVNRSAMSKLVDSVTKKGYIQRGYNDGRWHVFAISTK